MNDILKYHINYPFAQTVFVDEYFKKPRRTISGKYDLYDNGENFESVTIKNGKLYITCSCTILNETKKFTYTLSPIYLLFLYNEFIDEYDKKFSINLEKYEKYMIEYFYKFLSWGTTIKALRKKYYKEFFLSKLAKCGLISYIKFFTFEKKNNIINISKNNDSLKIKNKIYYPTHSTFKLSNSGYALGTKLPNDLFIEFILKGIVFEKVENIR